LQPRNPPTSQYFSRLNLSIFKTLLMLFPHKILVTAIQITHLFQNLSNFFRFYPTISESVQLFQNISTISESIHLYSESIQLFQNLNIYFRIYPTISEFIHLFQNLSIFSESIQLFQNLSNSFCINNI
jgi:hypothetical protein